MQYKLTTINVYDNYQEETVHCSKLKIGEEVLMFLDTNGNITKVVPVRELISLDIIYTN